MIKYLNHYGESIFFIILSSGIGLVYVDASVWQMLRGSIIIFAGILSVSDSWTSFFIYRGGETDRQTDRQGDTGYLLVLG